MHEVDAVCAHPEIRQISTVTAETWWTRQDDGRYEPDAEMTVLGEDTEWWECVECGEKLGRPAV
jgi:hypothetical protein